MNIGDNVVNEVRKADAMTQVSREQDDADRCPYDTQLSLLWWFLLLMCVYLCVQWRRQLRGTGARAPSTSNNFIFSSLWSKSES